MTCAIRLRRELSWVGTVTLGILLVSTVAADAVGQTARADTCIYFIADDFGCVPPGETTHVWMEVGVQYWLEACDTLTVYNITSSDSNFKVLETGFPWELCLDCPRGTSENVNIEFDCPGFGNHHTFLTVTSDDPSLPTLNRFVTAWSYAVPVLPDSIDLRCVDTLSVMDPPYEVQIDFENAGCAELWVDSLSLDVGTDYWITYAPTRIGPNSLDVITLEFYPATPGFYWDTLYVYSSDDFSCSDSSSCYEKAIPLIGSTRNPQLPDSFTTFVATDHVIWSCPGGDTQEFQRFGLALKNAFACPLEFFPVADLDLDFDVYCPKGQASHLSYEVLDDFADENGVVDFIVRHEEWPGPSYPPDCCEYTLTASHGDFEVQAVGTCKSLDLTGDWAVDTDDWNVFVLCYETSNFCCDFNNDGWVDGVEFALLNEHIQNGCHAGITEAHGAGEVGVAEGIVRFGPNPSAATTEILYAVLAEGGPVSVKIYDTRGRLVRVLEEGRKSAGVHQVLWDRRDGDGRAVASGVYFCRVDVAGKGITRKLVLLD